MAISKKTTESKKANTTRTRGGSEAKRSASSARSGSSMSSASGKRSGSGTSSASRGSGSSARAASAKSGASGGSKAKGAGGASRSSSAGSHMLTDHEEIQEWAEDRGAVPSCVRGTGGSDDVGMIRLDFPNYGNDEQSLQPIEWDEWFEKFDENGLGLLVQEKTAAGEKSNFNKLVKRTAEKEQPKTRTARS
jgi:hypothetical protein